MDKASVNLWDENPENYSGLFSIGAKGMRETFPEAAPRSETGVQAVWSSINDILWLTKNHIN